MTSQKNVMLITVDQWSGNYLGCAGNTEILTPSLDVLARTGIRYSNAVSATPVCIPARRELMTGVCARVHGDRKFNESLPMPEGITPLAQAFRDQGYQAYCVGKLHIYPQRDRCGFDDVLLNEEGRHLGGMMQDDYERYVMHQGYAGLENCHGMSNNYYIYRPYPLPEELHQTSWTARQMCETIIRRDPTKPCFWYLSFAAPHPPITPPQAYLDMYNDIEFSAPPYAPWAKEPPECRPAGYNHYHDIYDQFDNKRMTDIAKRGYYASCTYIDHQIRTVIGTLREQHLLDDTIILFTADHGEMLGQHGLYGKFLMYENSVRIPFILNLPRDMGFDYGVVDDRIVELRDVYPTLLELCGLEVPDFVNGLSVLGSEKRDYTYGELWEDHRATRMIRTDKMKLIYYLKDHVTQLFDIANDPDEMNDLSNEEAYQETRYTLEQKLISELYGEDEKAIKDGRLLPRDPVVTPYQKPALDPFIQTLHLQRGIR